MKKLSLALLAMATALAISPAALGGLVKFLPNATRKRRHGPLECGLSGSNRHRADDHLRNSRIPCCNSGSQRRQDQRPRCA